MFQKVFEYAGPHKKGLYAATAIVLVSVLLGVFPFVLAYQVIAPLVMGEAITASFIIQHVILVLVCLVLQALFYGWGLNLSHKAAYDTLLRLRTALQKRFEKLPLGVLIAETLRHLHNLLFNMGSQRLIFSQLLRKELVQILIHKTKQPFISLIDRIEIKQITQQIKEIRLLHIIQLLAARLILLHRFGEIIHRSITYSGLKMFFL